ncbi:MAG: heme o synthase [Limnochordales bacterium]|nr:MAG: protoheme IX farnesyltransferase [Bacillota bacterium]
MAQVATNPTVRRTAGDFLALTKPTIMLLVLVTGFLTLFVIPGEMPSPGLVVTTVLGTAMASGSANALNMYFDRDIDQIMKRTRTRPIPAGKVTPNEALMFGIGLGVASVALLWTTTNALAAVIALSGILFYVCVYTLFLKRRTPQNIVIGGAAGSVAPLIAWAAVTGTVALPAWLLFLVIFLWTPPHFWALALLASEDYARAGVPMLPVVRGHDETRKQIFIYTALLVPLTLAFYLIDFAGVIFLAGGMAVTLVFLQKAWKLLKDKSRESARDVFIFSIFYLALWFVALLIDRVFL